MPRAFEDMVNAWERSSLDGTPLEFGEMETWGDSIPRVLRTLGCMTQARWACDLFHVILVISDETFRQPDM